ncbi:Beta-amyrin 11-oxidase [Arachis hypogaea]|nr:Beta-amyrin 11-oxidase [Arachis hypogaea]
MKMEIISWVWMSGATLLAWYFLLNTLGRRLNEWYYDFKLGDKHRLLPPGDMGWPLLDNTWHYFKHPHLFMDNLLSKYGGNGMYKTHLFMKPSILVCTLEDSRRVLSDDKNFRLAYPETAITVVKTILYEVSNEDHKRYNALAMFLERIEDIVVNSLQVMADNSMQQPIEVFKETKSISMRVILHIFMGSYNEKIINQVEHLFGHINDALFSWPIYLPGFSYYNALQNRKKVQKIVKSVVEDRKTMLKNGEMLSEKKDLVDVLLELEDVNGRKLKGEDIVDLLILFLIAGHLSTATVMMWAMIYLSNNPLAFKKAKEEQEEIIKSRPPSQQYLSIEEIKQMVYLTKDISYQKDGEQWFGKKLVICLLNILKIQKSLILLDGMIKIIQMEEPSFLLELEQGYVQEEISPKLKCSSFFTISFVIISLSR